MYSYVYPMKEIPCLSFTFYVIIIDLIYIYIDVKKVYRVTEICCCLGEPDQMIGPAGRTWLTPGLDCVYVCVVVVFCHTPTSHPFQTLVCVRERMTWLKQRC